jgi:anti-sigma regulatory factor (Ser/Thr protein kinase)
MREISLPADDPGLLEQARLLVDEAASELGFDEDAIWDMKLAATEALTNAIQHGPLSPDRRIHMRLAPDRDNLVLEVWGGGTPPEARNVGDTQHGRGISIMIALMDEFELKRSANDGVIRLAKQRGPIDPTPH